MLKEHATHDAGSDADVDVHIPHKSDVRLGIQLCPGDDAEGLKERAAVKTKPFVHTGVLAGHLQAHSAQPGPSTAPTAARIGFL